MVYGHKYCLSIRFIKNFTDSRMLFTSVTCIRKFSETFGFVRYLFLSVKGKFVTDSECVFGSDCGSYFSLCLRSSGYRVDFCV